MKVIWSSNALNQREEIALYVAKDNRDAAKRLVRLFEESSRKLAQFPYLGRPGRVVDTRELPVHKHYFIVYEITDNEVIVLAIWHTSMQYPPFVTSQY